MIILAMLTETQSGEISLLPCFNSGWYVSRQHTFSHSVTTPLFTVPPKVKRANTPHMLSRVWTYVGSSVLGMACSSHREAE